MRGRRTPVLVVLLSLVLMTGLACQDQAAQEQAANEARWAELQEMNDVLHAARARRAELLERLEGVEAEADAEVEAEADQEAEPDEEGEAPEPDAMTVASPEALQRQIDGLEQEIETQEDQFNEQLVEFINEQRIEPGAELTETQRAALHMHSDHVMGVARRYIDEGGDYVRAIELYQSALRVDPEYEALQDALAYAEANRYMSEERFARVEVGMTEREVREAIGQVNTRNVREHDGGRRIGWYYPRGPEGAAAAVVFDAESRTVDAVEFNAVPPRSERQ